MTLSKLPADVGVLDTNNIALTTCNWLQKASNVSVSFIHVAQLGTASV